MFCYLWEYVVRPGRIDEFRAGYGPDGAWVRLFRRDSEYVRTELIADCDNPARFVTIDVWTSRKARDAFRERNREEWDAIDRDFEVCTLREAHLGDFEEWGAGEGRSPLTE